MAIVSSQVTVNDSADVIADFSSDTSGASGFSVNVRNRGAVAVYLGDADVLTTTGYQLDAGEAVGFYLESGDKLYGITASGSAVVHVLRGGA